MKEYIEREAVKAVFDDIWDCSDLNFGEPDNICVEVNADCGSCRWLDTKKAIEKQVMDIPVADVVEVVHCKNCACWNSEDPCDGEKLPGYCQLVNHQTKPTYYCGYGVQYENPIHT